MTLQEANERLNDQITEDDLCALNSAYVLFDLHKDVFCKIINAVGLEPILDKKAWYERCLRASDELSAKERYQAAVSRLACLQTEMIELRQIIDSCNPF